MSFSLTVGVILSRSLVNASKGNGAQTVKVRPEQVKNNAGGFVFEISPRSWLTRFLILGTDGGTYYVAEQAQAMESISQVTSLIKTDEAMVREVTRDISIRGRAYRNSPAIFVAAALLAYGSDKAANRELVQQVCRTSTHLFEFAEYVEALGGWGRAKRGAVADWYTSKTPDQLAYQAVKYRQRNGWSHRDLFRLSHPKGIDPKIGDFVLGKPLSAEPFSNNPLVWNFGRIQAATSVEDVLSVISHDSRLPWETIPTQFLTDSRVWKQLFYSGALSGQALIRNIKRLNGQKAFDDGKFLSDFVTKVRDPEMIRAKRLHPMQFLLAMVMNERLPGPLIDALEDGLDSSFGNHTPAGKRTMFALDVSGSMGWSSCAGVQGVSPAVGAAMMTMIGVRTEPDYRTMAFSRKLIPLEITKRMALKDIVRKTQNITFGGTDCAAPMMHAIVNKVPVDTFVVITDNETYAGSVHPFKALRDYRQVMGIDAKLVVQAMSPTKFSIADPSDPGMLDVVGLDSNTPSAIADFSAGRL